MDDKSYSCCCLHIGVAEVPLCNPLCGAQSDHHRAPRLRGVVRTRRSGAGDQRRLTPRPVHGVLRCGDAAPPQRWTSPGLSTVQRPSDAPHDGTLPWIGVPLGWSAWDIVCTSTQRA